MLSDPLFSVLRSDQEPCGSCYVDLHALREPFTDFRILCWAVTAKKTTYLWSLAGSIIPEVFRRFDGGYYISPVDKVEKNILLC